jgi:hypothetical protein
VTLLRCLVFLVVLAACDAASGARAAGREALSEKAVRYNPAPVRLLPWSERERIVVWLSHILISHAEATPDPILRPGNWAPGKLPARSRADAAKLALRIGGEAREHPDRFEALAREHSDDAVTRALGGSLGGMQLTQLPTELVDTVAALAPGEVSGVIVTSLGYHVLLRRSRPPREDVSGRRVVIGYKTLGASTDRAKARTREEAHAFALDVAAQARQGQTPFAELVRKFSDHGDRLYDGDLGVWSTTAPGAHPREVETLARLEIGQIAEPIDSIWGFQVLQRTAPIPRGRYAMAAIRLRASAKAASEDSRSRTSVERQARSLARELRADPARFTAEQAKHDSTGVESWDYGHGVPEITRALEPLAFGEVAAEPVEQPPFFVIPLRLDPALVSSATPEPLYELPTRVAPDVREIFRNADRSVLLEHFAAFKRPELMRFMRFTDKERELWQTALDALHKDLGSASTVEARVRAYDAAVKKLHTGMSAASYSRLMALVEQEVARIAIVSQ